jgi:hypothetical protein
MSMFFSDMTTEIESFPQTLRYFNVTETMDNVQYMGQFNSLPLLQSFSSSSSFRDDTNITCYVWTFFFFGATTPIWALAYLHETLRFTSVF